MALRYDNMLKEMEEQPSLLGDMIGRLEITEVRKRSLSESAKNRNCKNAEMVPQITVEDCSGNETTDDEFFNQPVRPRARTCPEDMFRQPKVRPPTPPPEDETHFKPISKHRSRERLLFCSHKLERVAEESRESKTESVKSSKKFSQKFFGRDKLKTNPPNKEISLLSKNKRTLISRPVGLAECL